jgi:hypothetical protein
MTRSTLQRMAGAILALVASPVSAQDGAGTAGATVLQLAAGSRAPALSGAYAAVRDIDALFYNPAGIGGLNGAASLSYERHVEDIGFVSGGGAFRIGRITVGASLLILDYGDVDEIVPDENFGGQTGRPTGNSESASELAARDSAAVPLASERLHLGLAAGWVSTDLAGATRGAPFLDAGLQYSLDRLTVGAALRNFGGSMSGNDLADAPLPRELRAGGAFEFSGTSRVGAVVSADVVALLEDGTTGVVGGLEVGLRPESRAGFGAVARAGYDATAGADALGALRLGGGLSFGGFALDYTWQRYDFFGTIHRFGVRWAAPIP